MVGEGRNNKTYADYLRDGNRPTPKYIMPPEAKPPFEAEVGGDMPSTSRQMARTTVDYIRMAERRQKSFTRGIRNEIVREIQRDSRLAGTN